MVFICLVCPMILFAQINTLSFEEYTQNQSINPRKSLLLIHTSWCIYCHQMIKEFEQEHEMANAINENYYIVLLDAETRKNIEYKGKKYVYLPNSSKSGIHELAFKLGEINGELSFPTLIFFNEKGEEVFKQNAYLELIQIEKIMKMID